MENPEEVLQALDEFQKLRPADIPKELEEYLSWVAKTGDPVYQWPLIKALFREKLLRVMTDFYESCPTLELAPCPNVEQFNYDIMKSALLDRLESFANAPFTVQRICELLTAPRKEYNRVDKFMRAIEKNILVVSTREPGLTARRSENGDGMVNGSSEDNGSRSPYDMDLWTRACTLATTVTVQTVETHSTIVNIHNLPTNIIPATELTIVKSNTAAATSVEAFTSYGTETDICDTEMSSKSQDLPSTFTPSTSEIASIANLTSQIQPQDLNSTSGIQNLSNMVTEPSNIVGDVPEAIMNEDTNSQPSLDLENNDSESFETTRKLQTTFQSSDFITHGIKSQKFYSEESKQVEKTVVEPETLRNEVDPLIVLDQKETGDNSDIAKAPAEVKSLSENGEPATSATVITADSIEMTDNVDKIIDGEPSTQSTTVIEENNEAIQRNTAGGEQTQAKECVVQDSEEGGLLKNGTESALLGVSTEKDDVSCAKLEMVKKLTESTTLVSATSEIVVSCTVEKTVKITQSLTIPEESEVATESKESKVVNQDGGQVAEDVRPANSVGEETDEIRESKECVEESEKTADDQGQENEVKIEEVSNDNDNKINNSIVPDPLPIVEEPKDEEPEPDVIQKQIIVDVTDEEKNKPVDTPSASGESEKALIDTVEAKDILKLNPEATDPASSESFSVDDPPPVVCSPAPIQDIGPAESMEIDVAEGSQTFQQDEPMEEEVSDLDKS